MIRRLFALLLFVMVMGAAILIKVVPESLPHFVAGVLATSSFYFLWEAVRRD